MRGNIKISMVGKEIKSCEMELEVQNVGELKEILSVLEMKL